jgi:hypothetical protein
MNEGHIRVFPRRTRLTPIDEWAFIGEPPLFRPPFDQAVDISVSAVFTWDIEVAKWLKDAWGQYYPKVRIGGPAISGPDGDFTPGLYVKRGINFTSRGCNNRCPWCLVPKMEGKIRLLKIQPGNVIQDNNFLQTGRDHMARVFEMLRHERYPARFAGGLDPELVDDWVAEELRSLRIDEVFLSADSYAGLQGLKKAAEKLSFLSDKSKRLRCYVLCAYGSDTPAKAEGRLWQVVKAGCTPFAQLYQPPDKFVEYSQEWQDLARKFMRPAIVAALKRKRERAADKLGNLRGGRSLEG